MAKTNQQKKKENMLAARRSRTRNKDEKTALRFLLNFATTVASARSDLPLHVIEALEAMRKSLEGMTLTQRMRDAQGSLNSQGMLDAFFEAMDSPPGGEGAAPPPPPPTRDDGLGLPEPNVDYLALPEVGGGGVDEDVGEDGGSEGQSIESELSGVLTGPFVAAEDLSSLPYMLGETSVGAEVAEVKQPAMIDFDAEFGNLLA